MKKSEIYRLLQAVVLDVPCEKINTSEKCEILRELFQQEDLAKFAEEHEGDKL